MKGANKDAISESITYIESRLPDNPNIDELAGQIFFSKTHYQRLFHAIVGEPVMEYIKKRRLEQACQALCQSETAVLDIALEHGYASHEGFTRAFKAVYGITPTQYRKKHAPGFNNKNTCKAVFDMLSNDSVKGIKQHTQTIAEALANFIIDLEGLCTSTGKTAIETGPNGKGILILLDELKNLAAKTGCLIESLKKFSSGKLTTFETSDAIYTFLTNIDDLAFQMNLLRFLSGIEVSRTGIDAFDEYQNELTDLSGTLLNHHSVFTNILKGLLALLMDDIRNDAVRCLRNAADTVNQTADIGKKIAEDIRVAALELPYGAGFTNIALEVERKTTMVTEVAAVINCYADKMINGAPQAPDRESVGRAIKSIKDIAFTMNLIGFNAAVETARCVENITLRDCADRVKSYALHLIQAYSACEEMLGECIKLSGLLEKSGEEIPKTMPDIFQKAMDDIIFQGGILAMQLGMEAERSGRDVFKQHAESAGETVSVLLEQRRGDFNGDIEALSVYVNAITTLTHNCRTDAESNMPHGMPFAFIAREFDVYVGKMNAVLDMVKR